MNVSTTMGSLADQTNPDSPYFSLIVPAYQSSKAHSAESGTFFDAQGPVPW